MNPNEETLIERLKEQAMDYHPTLKPHSFFKDKFQVSLFYVDDHAELLLSIRSLMYVCMRVLDPEAMPESGIFANQDMYLKQVLAIANRLMPTGDETFMDAINTFMADERLRERLDRG